MKISLTVVFLILCGSVCAQTNTFPASGSVGIGTSTPGYKLDVYQSSWKARFGGDDGYIIIGPANPSWAHIYTDRPAFLFNQTVYSYEGGFSSFNTADLSLRTNGTPRMTIANATGNVGIGISAPTTKLDVNGSARFYPASNAGTSGALKLQIVAGTSQTILQANSDYVWANHDIVINGANATAGNTNQLVVHRTGNVGIGTSNPNERLTVNGTIYGKEVKVDLSVPGPDYVFEQEYDLPSLEELSLT